MKIYEKFLMKNHSLLLEEIPVCAQLIGGNRIFKNKAVRKNTKQLKQLGHCSPASQD